MGGKQAERESEQRKEDEREGKTCKEEQIRDKEAVFRIRKVLGLPDPNSDPAII